MLKIEKSGCKTRVNDKERREGKDPKGWQLLPIIMLNEVKIKRCDI